MFKAIIIITEMHTFHCCIEESKEATSTEKQVIDTVISHFVKAETCINVLKKNIYCPILQHDNESFFPAKQNFITTIRRKLQELTKISSFVFCCAYKDNKEIDLNKSRTSRTDLHFLLMKI